MGKKAQTLGYIEGKVGRGRRARGDRELQNVTDKLFLRQENVFFNANNLISVCSLTHC